jgi:hypothetical protein
MNGPICAWEGKLCRVLMWTSRPLDVVPIPGTKCTEYVQESNADVFEPNHILGERYAPTHFAQAGRHGNIDGYWWLRPGWVCAKAPLER